MSEVASIFERLSRNMETHGDFASEEDATAAVLRVLRENRKGWFGSIYREVRGAYRRIAPGTDVTKTPRIDLVVMPSQVLMDAGWQVGPIFIEVKRSGLKLGPVVSQCMDYSNAVFEIKPGFWIEPQWVFCFPVGNPGGPIASVMAQNRIGMAVISKWSGLRLSAGSECVLNEEHETVRVPKPGRKVGSR